MDESVQTQQKSGLSKKTIAIVIGLLLIIGGSVAAYVLLDKTTKEKYFLAEQETFEFIGDSLTEKYKLETEWSEKTANNPNKAEHHINLGLAGSSLGGDSFGAIDPFDILSNVTFLFDVERNTKEKALSVNVGIDFANVDLGNAGISISEHDLFVELPFTDDIMHIEDSELNELLHELDPYTFTEDDFINFNSIFELFSNELLTKDDRDYLQEEYGKYTYEQIPESAFTEEKESITVHGEKLNANKITFHLSEDEFKVLLEDFFRKISRDERVRDILEQMLELQFTANQSLNASISTEDQLFITEILDDIEQGLKIARLSIPHLHIPDGMTSTVWVDQKKVVQRDFSVAIGADENDMLSLAIEGTHLLENDKQQYDIDLIFGDTYEEFPIHLEGEFNWKDRQGDDYLTLRAEDVNMTYESSEKMKDKSTKEFTRSLQFDDGYDDFALKWEGDATYASEKMKSSHTFSFIEGGIEDELKIHMDKKGSIIKEVTIPSKSESVQLGEMEMFEIDMYIEKLASEFEQWLHQLGGGMFGF